MVSTLRHGEIASDPVFPDPEILEQLANTRMPFGKYAGRLLLDLPEAYLLWFERQGYPSGALGEKLRIMKELKINSLEILLRPLVGS